jgi:putative Holliday junction resolvase
MGLAYGDELGVATPIEPLIDADPEKRWNALGEVLKRRGITEIVLGHPLNMDESVGFKAKEVEAFAVRLRDTFKLPVHLVDERLSSYEAEETIPRHQRRAVRSSGLIDSRAATIILGDYLSQRFPLSNEP